MFFLEWITAFFPRDCWFVNFDAQAEEVGVPALYQTRARVVRYPLVLQRFPLA